MTCFTCKHLKEYNKEIDEGKCMLFNRKIIKAKNIVCVKYKAKKY